MLKLTWRYGYIHYKNGAPILWHGSLSIFLNNKNVSWTSALFLNENRVKCSSKHLNNGSCLTLDYIYFPHRVFVAMSLVRAITQRFMTIIIGFHCYDYHLIWNSLHKYWAMVLMFTDWWSRRELCPPFVSKTHGATLQTDSHTAGTHEPMISQAGTQMDPSHTHITTHHIVWVLQGFRDAIETQDRLFQLYITSSWIHRRLSIDRSQVVVFCSSVGNIHELFSCPGVVRFDWTLGFK